MVGFGSTSQTVYGSVATAGSIASTTFGTLMATHALAAGSMAGPIGMAIGAVVAGVAELLSALGVGNGCGNSCIEATNIVNQAEPVFRQNLDAYEAGTLSSADAIANYNQLTNSVKQACGAIPGAAGQNCVSERFDPNSCKWKAMDQPYPSSPPVGACWNWVNGYYDPLTQPPVTEPSGNSLVGGGNVNWLIPAVAAIVGLMMVSK